MTSLLTTVLSYLSKVCGLDSIRSFPASHAFASTHWDPAYFDIPYGTKPDDIERSICTAIDNTPLIFAHINNPTPRMQRTLLAHVNESLRRNDGRASGLVTLLIGAYSSPRVHEVFPGFRAALAASMLDDEHERVRGILAFLANMPAPFDVIEARP